MTLLKSYYFEGNIAREPTLVIAGLLFSGTDPVPPAHQSKDLDPLDLGGGV